MFHNPFYLVLSCYQFCLRFNNDFICSNTVQCCTNNEKVSILIKIIDKVFPRLCRASKRHVPLEFWCSVSSVLLFCPAGGEGVEGEGQAEVNNIIEKIEAQNLSEENNGCG